MRLVDIVVLGGSLAFLLAFYGWFFWSKRDTSVAVTSTGGLQELDIEVKGGYAPDHVIVERGQPVRLNFRRVEDSSCTDRVLIPGLRVNKALPAFQTTAVEFTPQEAGEFDFHCGMNMVHGRITVT
jgi:plastocyanin domain-containing protein